MKLVFYSVVLNHHQASVADAFYQLLGDSYAFVETINIGDSKGATEDFSKRPYLLQAWKSEAERDKAMELAQNADACVFSGVSALPFQIERMKRGLLSFDMSERWLKRGAMNLFSPAILRMWLAYKLYGWNRRTLYKLCCSAFAAKDQIKLGTYKNKCYKWGYFTKVEKKDVEISSDASTSNITPLMWCSRYLMWKHPELPVLMAARLKKKKYCFVLDMYGCGEYEEQTKRLAMKLGVEDVVNFCGNKPNNELLNEMRKHEIFLFTSDRNEGWGAVANESLSNGCVLVASDAIGSTPYLVMEGENGFSFISSKTTCSFANPDTEALDSLCERVELLLNHPEERMKMKKRAISLMQDVWSPDIAAHRLLTLIDYIRNGKDTPFKDGPCSRA